MTNTTATESKLCATCFARIHVGDNVVISSVTKSMSHANCGSKAAKTNDWQSNPRYGYAETSTSSDRNERMARRSMQQAQRYWDRKR